MKTLIKAGTSDLADQIECENRVLAEKLAVEGAVLLKNEGALPLKEKKVALYGAGARMTVKGGTGSGAVRERYSVNVEKGLIKNGIEITTTNWLDRFDKFYQDSYQAYHDDIEERVKGMTQFYQILGTAIQHKFIIPTGIAIEQQDMEESDCSTAVYIIARQAGEGADRKNEKGDYQLDDIEVENLKTITSYYENVVVVINVGGVIDLCPLDGLKINSVVLMGQAGEEGGDALAALLVGRENFSGRLTMSWPIHYEDLVSSQTFAEASADPHVQKYNEDIFVGYRYFDTFKVAPRYLFGYGLSYTSFALQLNGYEQNAEEVLLHVQVTNIGHCAGKTPVQVYVCMPQMEQYHEYRRLAAFAKTPCLKPQESTECVLHINLRDLAVYDTEQSQFILHDGDMAVQLGTSTDALENVLALHVNASKVLEQSFHACPLQTELDHIIPVERTESTEGLPVLDIDTDALALIEHCYALDETFDDDINETVEKMSSDELCDLVIGATTQPASLPVTALGASGSTSPSAYEKYGIPNAVCSDGPQGLNLTSVIVEMEDGSVKAARVPHVLEAYKRYLFGIAGMGLKAKMAALEDGIPHYQYATAWPCELVIAQTFNTELAQQMGDGVAREMEKYGVTVWNGPALNIERNPMCGRTYEYYAEDPILSGKLAAAVIHGVQSHPGRYVSAKHFAANNAELNRNESDSIMSERALREVYLKGFEIAVKEGKPGTVMASYNMINHIYSTNNADLLIKILREEWGFRGMTMSDWDSLQPHTADLLKAQVNGCDLIMPGRADQNKALKEAAENGTVSIDALRTSVKRILTMIKGSEVLPLHLK